MVVYVESPSFLFLQRLDCQPELEKLSHEIEQYCTSFAEKQHQEVFQEGDFVLARYTDEVWYRAKVVETGADASLQVFFIDFGNSETIAPAKMVMCPENYLELPCQAIACSLANVPRRDSWPKEYKNLIDKQVSDRVVKVKVVHPASKGMRPTVNLEDRETGADVAQTVLNYLHDECELGNLSNYVIPEEPGEVEVPENPDQVTPKIDATDANDQPVPQLAEIVKGSQAATRNTAVPQRRLDIDSTYDVYVVSCDSPHSFFAQLASESESLDETSTALESAYENVDTLQLVLPGPPIVGDYVCGQYTEDLKWYRAKVLGFDPSDQNQVELLFIDYGNREMGDVSNLRTLSPTLPSQPPFALECFLAGVEPPEGQGSFGADASQHVLELTGHAESVCKIEVKFADSAGHYGVNLSSDEGVNVVQSLVDGNLATRVYNNYTYLEPKPLALKCVQLSLCDNEWQRKPIPYYV
jgi:tudor domain-containing protein 1/4/6/7